MGGTKALHTAQQWALVLVTGLLALWLERVVTIALAVQQGIDYTHTLSVLLLSAPQEVWVDCSCVVGIYLAGPLVCLVLGALLLGLYPLYATAPPWIRQLGLLFGIQLMVRFLGGWAAGIAADEGLYYAMAWLYWPSALQNTIAFLGGVGAFVLGYTIRTRLFLGLAYTEAYLAQRKVTLDALRYYVLPLLLALLLELVVYWPDRHDIYQVGFYGLTFLLVLAPALWGQRHMEAQGFLLPDEEDEIPYRFHWWLAVSAALVAALLWWML